MRWCPTHAAFGPPAPTLFRRGPLDLPRGDWREVKPPLACVAGQVGVSELSLLIAIGVSKPVSIAIADVRLTWLPKAWKSEEGELQALGNAFRAFHKVRHGISARGCVFQSLLKQ